MRMPRHVSWACQTRVHTGLLTPFNGPLLNAHDAASLGGRGQLGKVDNNLTGSDANGEATDNTTADEVANVLGGALEYRTDDEDDRSDHEGAAATPFVRDPSSDEGADERAAGHGGSDAALGCRVGVAKELQVRLIGTVAMSIGRVERESGGLTSKRSCLRRRSRTRRLWLSALEFRVVCCLAARDEVKHTANGAERGKGVNVPDAIHGELRLIEASS
jgi:hypothetical protein